MLFPEKLRIRENSRISGAGNSSGPAVWAYSPVGPPQGPKALAPAQQAEGPHFLEVDGLILPLEYNLLMYLNFK